MSPPRRKKFLPYKLLIYKLILKARARRWRRAAGVEVPSVCVGNVTVGGTGKTPHTEMILDLLQQSDRWGNSQIGMLSRGYKRKSKGYQTVSRESTASFAGDEPLQVKRKFPAVSVSVDKNRVRGAGKLIKDGVRLLVLDDAFQYKKLHASLNIVLVDYMRPVFADGLLPFGRLRDLPERIFEADMIIVSKCPAGMEAAEKAAFAENLRLTAYDPVSFNARTPKGKELKLLFSKVEYCQPEPVFEGADPRYCYAPNVVPVTGIANDAPFKAWLSDSYKVNPGLSFPDHHKFGRADIAALKGAARRYPTALLATTEKDAVRFRECSKLPPELRKRLFCFPIKAVLETEGELQCLSAALDALQTT